MENKFTEEELNQFSKQMLIKLLMTTTEQMNQLQEQMKLLTEQINVLTQHQFGQHSEKRKEETETESNCMNEAEVTVLESEKTEEPTMEQVCPVREKKRPVRKKGKLDNDLKDFPVTEVVHELSDEEKNCACDGVFKEVGEDIYRKLVFHPAYFEVEEHHVKAYSCNHCHQMKRANRSVDLFKHSIVTPSLLASIINEKYVNAMPLNRREQEFKRYDINISRQTMAHWIIHSSELYFSLLYGRLKQELLLSPVIHADETPLEVSKDGRPSGSKSFMWVYHNGIPSEKPVAIYEYQKTRNGEHPKKFLEGFEGNLCCDGYQVYHSLPESIRVCGCWAHGRRHFVNSSNALKGVKGRKEERTFAEHALNRIGLFFHMDSEWDELPLEEKLENRQRILKPIVEDFFTWIEKERPNIPPKSEAGKGITYCLNQKKYLMAFLEDARVPLDNSAAERAIRSFTIGRKNFVMIDTVAGAEASAMLYSIVETAKANNLKPYSYFEHLLTEIPKHMDDKTTDFLEDLLPWSEKLPAEIRAKN